MRRFDGAAVRPRATRYLDATFRGDLNEIERAVRAALAEPGKFRLPRRDWLHESWPLFDGRTAISLIRSGRAADVIGLLAGLESARSLDLRDLTTPRNGDPHRTGWAPALHAY